MTTAGWIIMISAISGMTGLLAWCIYKVLSTPEATKHLHAPVEIDTRD
ncbi:MAG TPA: hypothetical protein PKE26_11990 [Kiritimatiellia bacterium]|nr:hypothetical protein [Kiritimatiellia bacterium]HMO99822.1 hypothetical protein [Kiritimatiellia bacterium]HMP97306.1 hypothetical protein [Kiritimatiellia bacterium]